MDLTGLLWIVGGAAGCFALIAGGIWAIGRYMRLIDGVQARWGEGAAFTLFIAGIAVPLGAVVGYLLWLKYGQRP